MQRALLLITLSVVVLGCQRGPVVVGQWTGSLELPASAGDGLTPDQQSTLRAMSNYVRAALDIQEDNRFTFKMGNVEVTGTWAMQDDATLRLAPTVGAKSMDLRVEPDRMILDDGLGTAAGRIIFVRAAEKK